MRMVIVGLGAIGGVMAGRLVESGHDVVGVARGQHLAAIKADGLGLSTPEGHARIPLDVVDDPASLRLTSDDVVILAVKSQDTAGVVDRLRLGVPTGTVIVSAQNGVANELTLSRVFDRVLGMVVVCPAVHLEPGEVAAYSAPVTGVLSVGRYPGGHDAASDDLAGALNQSGFAAESVPDIMRGKYGKLRSNLANAVEATCGRSAEDLIGRIRAEGDACLAAAGIDFASDAEQARQFDRLDLQLVDGRARPGGSTWQSLARGSASTEVDFLNGEITMLGRIHGISTPANRTVMRVLAKMVREHQTPGSYREADLLAEIDAGAT